VFIVVTVVQSNLIVLDAEIYYHVVLIHIIVLIYMEVEVIVVIVVPRILIVLNVENYCLVSVKGVIQFIFARNIFSKS